MREIVLRATPQEVVRWAISVGMRGVRVVASAGRYCTVTHPDLAHYTHGQIWTLARQRGIPLVRVRDV